MHVLYYQNETLVELIGLQDEVSETEINDASVDVTVRDRASGVNITGATWPIAMSSLGTGGDYRGSLPAALATSVGQRLVARVTVTVAAILVGTWEMDLVVERRGAGDRI